MIRADEAAEKNGQAPAPKNNKNKKKSWARLPAVLDPNGARLDELIEQRLS
jgi:hypothetical protein